MESPAASYGALSRDAKTRGFHMCDDVHTRGKKAGFGRVMLNSFNDEESVGDCHLFFIWGT